MRILILILFLPLVAWSQNQTTNTFFVAKSDTTFGWKTVAEIRSLLNIGNVTGTWSDTSRANIYNAISSKQAAGSYGYMLNVQALTSAPTDAQTIYFGQLPKAPVTGAATSKIFIRKAGTIKIANIYSYSGTAGSNEAWVMSIRLNNATDTQIASVAAATNERVFVNSNLNIAVVAGDYIEIKLVNPTWATNPNTSIFGGYIYIE